MPDISKLTVAGTSYTFRDTTTSAAAEAAQEAATAAQNTATAAQNTATAAQNTAETANNKAAQNAADIAELKENNYIVEVKDTVTENAADNYESHDFKETNHDGTENAVSNFVVAQKQITKLATDVDAGTLTVSTVDQTGAAGSETLSLPSGGGASYDDTQLKADIAANTSAIETTNNNVTAVTSRVSQNETDIASLKNAIIAMPDYSAPITIPSSSDTSWTATENCYVVITLNAQDTTINGHTVSVYDSGDRIFAGFLSKGDVLASSGYLSSTQYVKAFSLK